MRRITSLMQPEPASITTHTTVSAARSILRKHDIRHLPVVDVAGVLVGIVTDVDVTLGLRTGMSDALAEDIAFRRPCAASADEPAARVLARQIAALQDATIVVDGASRPIGIFTDHDAFRLAEFCPGGLGLVRDTMHPGPAYCVKPETTSGAALRLMSRRQIHHLLVHDGEQLFGVVSHRDLVGRNGRPVRLAAQRWTWHTQPDAPLSAAIDAMRDRKIGCLPVIDGEGRVVGMLSRTDIVRRLTRELLASTVPGPTRKRAPTERDQGLCYSSP